MASNARVFFAGVGTTFFILAIGFSGGLMLAKSAMEPTASAPSIADRLPPARIILPASAEAATPSPSPVEAIPPSQPPTSPVPVKEAQPAPEKDKQVERAERRKAEAEERARRKKYAERKARREAARLAIQQKEQHQARQPGILAFGGDADQSSGAANFFGN